MLLPGRLLGAPAQTARCARSCLRLRLAVRMTQTDAAQQQALPPAAAAPQQRSPPCATTTPLAVQIPPPKDFYGLGARVEHVLAPREGRLSVLVAEALQLPQSFAEALIEFGAVHTCTVPPAPPPELEAGLPAEEAAEMRRVREAALQAAGGDLKKNPRLRMPQRASEDAVVGQHAYIRVHVHPKRFPAAYAVRWEERIIANGDDFVVVNKPAGVPVAPTVDNVIECVPALAAKAVGHPAPLLITHRLDQVTEGVLVLGKTPEFVARFNALIRRDDRAVRKWYRALSADPPPPGPLIHHLSVQKRQALLPFHTLAHDAPTDDSAPCELHVLEVREVELAGEAAERWGPTGHECLLELITGKTHQIRAQLSAVGCPLLGDDLYAPLASAELRQRLHSNDPTLKPVDERGVRLLSEPVGGIGLQACRLVVARGACMGREDGGAAEFEAGPPWWRMA